MGRGTGERGRRHALRGRSAHAATSKRAHIRATDIRGASRVVVDGIIGLTRLVEAMHVVIARGPVGHGVAPTGRARGITGFAYRMVRGVAGGVGRAIDFALGHLAPRPGPPGSSPQREAVLAALNGVLGDHLAATGNPLAIPMSLRFDGKCLEPERETLRRAIPAARPRLLLMVHGLCMNDLQWRAKAQDPVAALARTLDCTALYVHYNTGRHVSENGRDLAQRLEALVDAWPVPVESLTVVAHSMGGLVTRSACRYAAASGLHWLERLRDLVFVATPHHGAPLERGGHWIDLILEATPYTAPLARLGKIRSAGITDMRYGNVLDEDWHGRDRFAGGGDRRHAVPLPHGPRCHAIAGCIAREPGDAKMLGDGLVPVDSALGRHDDPARTLDFPPAQQWIGTGMNHLDLLARPEVWARIGAWLSRETATGSTPGTPTRDR